MLVNYIREPGTFWNNKVKKIASGEIFWSVNTFQIQIEYKHKKDIQRIIHNEKFIKIYENVYIITYLIYSYFPLQWEVRPLVGYSTKIGTLIIEKFTMLASDEIFWSISTLHFQIIYS